MEAMIACRECGDSFSEWDEQDLCKAISQESGEQVLAVNQPPQMSSGPFCVSCWREHAERIWREKEADAAAL